MDDKKSEKRLEELEFEMSNQESKEVLESYRKEKSFRKAIENAIPSGIAVIDDTGRQVYVNPAFCKMTGWSKDDLVGQSPPYVYWSPDDMENINEALQKTLNNDAPQEGFDLVFSHKTGKPIYVNVIISPFIQENKRTFWLANVIDITKRKQEEEALIKSKILLRSSIESMKEIIFFSIDKDYKYSLYNEAHRSVMKFAYNADIRIDKSILDYISVDVDRKLLKNNFDLALRGQSHSQIQTFGDQNIAHYEVFYDPIMNDNDEIIGCTGLAKNITERKQIELALKESETKFKEIIDQINDGIIVFDKQGKIIIWNQGMEKINGLKASDTINKNIVDIRYQFTPKEKRDRKKIEETIQGIIMRQTPEAFNRILDSEIISLNPPYLRNIQSVVFPIEFQDHTLFCAVLRDTTEIKRYENEIQRISEDKDKFYSVIAQYLYTPFNSFYNFTKLMAVEMDTLPIKELQKMAVMMSKSATNLYSLLDNMLQYTKMNQGKITFKPQKLNFTQISNDAVSILKPNAELKNIKIHQYVSEEIDVYADSFMLKTILRNLVSNAIKHTQNDGQIEISAQKADSHVLISIINNGTGLSTDHLAKLFNISEIHATLDKSEEKGGTLGLFLCKEFVEKHGGQIWVESDIAKGSHIKFTLPSSN